MDKKLNRSLLYFPFYSTSYFKMDFLARNSKTLCGWKVPEHPKKDGSPGTGDKYQINKLNTKRSLSEAAHKPRSSHQHPGTK